MSEIKEFNLLEYLNDDGIYLENVSLKNCSLVSSEECDLQFRKCIFQNVIIDGNNGIWGNAAVFEECEFRNCIFRGDFGEIYLEWSENYFKDCLFENISIEGEDDTSTITANGFFDCMFKNVNINQIIELLEQMISGGKMQNVLLYSSDMSRNLFVNVQMQKVKIQALYSENVMDSVIFKDVLLEWESEDDSYPDENIFFQCDTSGLTCQKHEVDEGEDYDEDDDYDGDEDEDDDYDED